MKKMITVCDFCGEEVHDMPHIIVEMQQDVWEKILKKLPKDTYSVLFSDVHADCLPEIRKVFSDEPLQRRTNTGRPQTFDRKKIVSLREAGWTIPQIAAEMKCGKSTVGSILHDEKEKAASQ